MYNYSPNNKKLETKKQLSIQQDNNQQYEIMVTTLREERVKLTSQSETMVQRYAEIEQKIDHLQAQRESDIARHQDLQIALVKAQTEAAIKEQIIANLSLTFQPEESERRPENEDV